MFQPIHNRTLINIYDLHIAHGLGWIALSNGSLLLREAVWLSDTHPRFRSWPYTFQLHDLQQVSYFWWLSFLICKRGMEIKEPFL